MPAPARAYSADPRAIEDANALILPGVGHYGRAMDKLRRLDLRWHLIGHLQSNKAAQAAPLFDCIESVDRAKLLPLLDAARGASGRDPLDVRKLKAKPAAPPEPLSDAVFAKVAAELGVVFDKLLQIAEVESGASRKNFAPVDLRALLVDVVEFYEPLVEDAGGVLRLEVEGMPMALGDGRFADNIVHFARVLRKAGLKPGPGAVIDAAEPAAAVCPTAGAAVPLERPPRRRRRH